MDKLDSTRNVMRAFDVENGVITTPGKFEGMPVYLPQAIRNWINNVNVLEDDGDEARIAIEFDGEERIVDIAFMDGTIQEI